MSAAAAEAAINLNLRDMPTFSISEVDTEALPYPSSSIRPDSYASVELYTPASEYDLKDGYFDGDLGSPSYKPESTSEGLADQGGYFDGIAVLEKGEPVTPVAVLGDGEAAPSFAVTPFVLEDPVVRREGGWAGWTCVAGSWLICMSPSWPLRLLRSSTDRTVFATSGYANAFGVSWTENRLAPVRC